MARGSESQASQVGISAPLRCQLSGRVPGGRGAGCPLYPMSSARRAATAAALTATLGLAAACWVVAVRQMSGIPRYRPVYQQAVRPGAREPAVLTTVHEGSYQVSMSTTASRTQCPRSVSIPVLSEASLVGSYRLVEE